MCLILWRNAKNKHLMTFSDVTYEYLSVLFTEKSIIIINYIFILLYIMHLLFDDHETLLSLWQKFILKLNLIYI